MAKFTWSEAFLSIEGEGPHSGKATAYIRLARCNFTCAMFNNPERKVDAKGYAPLNFHPKDFNTIQELTPMEVGCDTQYSVNPAFAHMWLKGDEAELSQAMLNLLPGKSWKHPKNGTRVILSLTGGEPTLAWKTIPTLLMHPNMDELETVLFETNCAVKFKQEFIDGLNIWIEEGKSRGLNRKIVWSNSPKLAASGEAYDKAIIPEIAIMQRGVSNYEQYFKFVCDALPEHFDEVAHAMDDYHAAGIPNSSDVLIMPMSCTEDQQKKIMQWVADECIQRGYVYCHRVHNTVYENAIGK
jgi:organic radical activating enzyme